jgi:hypothetical protein
MRLNIETLTVGFLLLSSTPAIAYPQPITDIQLISEPLSERTEHEFADVSDLWKRKGGGGGGGKGGSGSSGSSSGSSSSGSSSSGSSSSGSSSSSSSSGKTGSSSSSRYATSTGGGSLHESKKAHVVESVGVVESRGRSTPSTHGGGRNDETTKHGVESPSSLIRPRFVVVMSSFRGFSSGHSGSSKTKSNSYSSSSSGKGSSSSSTGGSTKQGSGVQPSYGGGRYYGGGATTPYRAGVASPLGIAPFALGAGALAFYPGIWLYGAYAYPYSHPYTFRNHSATNSTNKSTRDLWVNALVLRQDTGVSQTKNVTCLCAMYSECGCDDNGNSTFLDSIIGDGSYASLNKSLVDVADINGTSTIVLNGTLPNGTTTSGGTENANAGNRMIEASGYWVMIALVGCTVLLV